MPIVNIPALGNVQFPDDMPLEEIDRVIRQELKLKDQYGVGETIARGLERGVTSTIRGAAQLLGAPSATVPTEEQDAISQMQGTPLGEQRTSLATPDQLQKTDIQREAEFRAMAEQRPVAAYGSMIAGNILDPINLVPLGGVRTLAQGARNVAAAGGVMGALEPVYGEDSRLINIAGGAVLGGALGAGVGGLIQKYGKEAVEAAGKELKDNRAVLLGGTGRITQDTVPLSPLAQEIADVTAAKNMELQDSIVPLLQQLEDSELAQKREGAGRPVGAKNKRSAEIEEKLAALNCDPIEGMATIAADPTASLELKLQAFKELAQYVAPKRKAVEMELEGSGSFNINVVRFSDVAKDTDGGDNGTS